MTDLEDWKAQVREAHAELDSHDGDGDERAPDLKGRIRALNDGWEAAALEADRARGEWQARALKAEGELERWTLMPSVTVGGGQQVYGELDAISRVQDYILLDSTHPVEREDVRRSLARALQAAEAELTRLSASRGEVDGWRPSREAVARIVDSVAFDHVQRWAAPNFNVSSAHIEEAKERVARALAKADAILSLPPLDEGKG